MSESEEEEVQFMFGLYNTLLFSELGGKNSDTDSMVSDNYMFITTRDEYERKEGIFKYLQKYIRTILVWTAIDLGLLVWPVYFNKTTILT